MGLFFRNKTPQKNQRRPVVPPNWNYPRSSPGDTGNQQIAVPKGYSAPLTPERPDVILDQRLSERITAFTPRHPLQTMLRQQKVVQVVPQLGIAHYIDAAPIMTYSDSMYVQGAYNTDYSEQTQMGQVRNAPGLSAPKKTQSIPGYTDVSSQIVINNQYSTINASLAGLYMNLRAPLPFEGQLVGCQ